MRDRNAPLSGSDIAGLAWGKMDGLLPAIVQDRRSGRVLMVGYMNREALEATLETGLATFFSRSRQRLWQKGERNGNRLHVRAMFADCDDDALLVLADAEGPTCHTGTLSCFGNEAIEGPGWLGELADIVRQRADSDDDTSYTRRLLGEGRIRIAQKVGEEGVEVALAAVTRDAQGCAEEVADLLYHLTVLMQSLGFGWDEVIALLRSRHMASRHAA
jgi:phosphoribosyl-ATP pyrophosphohydrolase/phosphoribosyl-AMP cyclohydrolase